MIQHHNMIWQGGALVDLIKTHRLPSPGKVHVPKKEYPEKAGRSARPWRRLRQKVLTRDMYRCQKCGTVGPDMDVDHIIPLSKDGKDEASNLQTLCRLCHRIKTLVEAGVKGMPMCPEWMPKFSKPLILVCGRPSSGKKTFVKTSATRLDMVVDLNLMALEMNRKLYELSKEELSALVHVRNNRLNDFAKGLTHYQRCFLITTAGAPYMRTFWQDLGAQVHIVDTPADVCQRRINARDLPAAVKITMMQAAQEWA